VIEATNGLKVFLTTVYLHDGLLSTGLIIAVMGVVYWDLQKIAPINSALKLPAAIPTLSLIFGKERIDCVVPIPSRRHPNLVPCFARELAKDLGIAWIEALG